MTRDEILDVYTQVSEELCRGRNWSLMGSGPALERFAHLIAARAAVAEREACAQVCDAVQKQNEDVCAWLWEAKLCAATIRARGQQ